MKHILLLLLLVVIAAPAFPQSEGRWEYAMIFRIWESTRDRKSVGGAEVCYAQPSGCRFETVEMDFDTGLFGGRSPYAKHQILAKVIHHLGEMGYELVSYTPRQRHENEPEVLFFKRPRK